MCGRVGLALLLGLAASTQALQTEVSGKPEQLRDTSRMPLVRTAFIVRLAANEKDVAKVGRAVEFASELQERVPEVDFWVSIDETPDHSKFTKSDWSEVPEAGNKIIRMGSKNQGLNLVQKDHASLHTIYQAFQNKSLPMKLHYYTEKDILAEYPSIAQAAERAKEACKGEEWCQQPLGWQFHSEALGLWWKHNNLGYDHVWVSEPDMNFNGKLGEIVETYALNRPNKDADLMPMILPGWPPKWMWEKTATDSFIESTQLSPLTQYFGKAPPLLAQAQQTTQTNELAQANEKCTRMAAPEYITLFSARLLDKMTEWCGKQGKCAHSEAFAATVAYCEGMKVGAMDPRLLTSVRHDGGPLR